MTALIPAKSFQKPIRLFSGRKARRPYGYPREFSTGPLEQQILSLATVMEADPLPALAYARTLPGSQLGRAYAIGRSARDGTYEQAVDRILNLLTQKFLFEPWRVRIGPHRLRESDRKKEMMQVLAAEQAGDILIIYADFGFRHRGKSVRRARDTFSDREFGLGVYEVACMLLTHPHRLENRRLHIDCAGDEYSMNIVDRFDDVPSFSLLADQLFLKPVPIGYPSRHAASASGFLSQQ